jgi:hypothetical protein
MLLMGWTVLTVSLILRRLYEPQLPALYLGSLLIVDIRLKSPPIQKTPPLDPRMTPHPAKRIIGPTSTLGPITTLGQMKRTMEETTTHGGQGSPIGHIGPPMAGLLSQLPPRL